MLSSLLSKMLRPGLDLLFPPGCVLCGAGIDTYADAVMLCDPCSRPMTLPASHCCPRCGAKCITSFPDDHEILVHQGRNLVPSFPCPQCQTTPPLFHRTIVLGEYEAELRQLVLRMKSDRRGILARAGAALLWQERETMIRDISADFIIPIPMHRARRFWRGVNSPHILAEELAERTGIDLAASMVRRVKATRPQFRLTPKQRFENMREAFRFANKGAAGQCRGCRIFLVDDILTTGATCNALSRLLLDAGAAAITVIALARARGGRRN